MTCDEARVRISWLLDGELDEPGRRELEGHLAGCDECRRRREELAGADSEIRKVFVRARPSETFGRRVVEASRPLWRRRWVYRLGASVAALMLLGAGLTLWVNTLKPPPLQVAVHGSGSFHADAMGALRVFVLHGAMGPIAGASVRVLLAGSEVGSFRTGPAGSIDGFFRVPNLEDGPYPLRLEVDTPIGKDVVERTVTVKREYRLLLTTDKPLYQPGQTILMRALALNAFTLKPRAGDAEFEVLDSKGNRIFRAPVKMSDFGVGSAEMAIADEVNLGTYRIAVTASGLRQERTVEVAKYVLPKFRVDLELDRTSYRPGQPVKGVVRARYFFGKSVRGRVHAKVGREVVAGQLRDDGSWEFETPSPAEGNHALEVTVTDTADHRESKSAVVIVAREALKVVLVADGDGYVPAMENDFFILVSAADGRPVKADLALKVHGKDVTLATDDLGVARVKAGNPHAIRLVRARDGAGNETRELQTVGSPGEREFMVQLDKPAYKGGETMTVRRLGGSGSPIFVDVVKGGQLILAKAMEGKELAVDLPPDLFGTVHVLAYRNAHEPPVVRVAYVNVPEGLRIRPRASKETYRPGEEMPVEFEVLDPDGRPVQAALGISVVDEALFGLVEAKIASEKAWLSLSPELIDTRGFLQADASRIYQGTNPQAQAFVSGNGRAERAPRIAENGFERRAAELQDFIESFNVLAFGVAKVSGVILLVGLGMAAIGFIGLGVRRLTKASFGRGILAGIAIVMVPALLLMVFSASKVQYGPPGEDVVAVRAEPRPVSVEEPPSPSAPAPALKPHRDPFRKDQALTTLNPSDPTPAAPEEAPAARVREHFPETLFWRPELITDEQGRARVTLPPADSITSWRLLANAVSRGGALGTAQADLRVFQDFFADIDFPLALTKGDRVHVPVAVYNYLKESQTVAVRVQKEPWFDLLDEESKSIVLQAGEVSVVAFGLRVKEHGRKALTVFAEGKVKDALRRTVEVMEKGREVAVAASDRVNGRRTFRVELPAGAIEGASVLYARITPGIGDLVEGLERMIRMPYG